MIFLMDGLDFTSHIIGLDRILLEIYLKYR